MDDLLKLVKTYRLTPAVDQRLRLADQICRYVIPKLSPFVSGAVVSSSASDVLQEVLKAISFNLPKFQGHTEGEFWAWCYRIARHKLADHFRRRGSDRLLPMGHDELQKLADASAEFTVRTLGVKHDLDHVRKLLSAAKPECFDLLWSYYVQGVGYAEIAEVHGLTYDAMRMKITRCLTEARALVS